MRTMWGLLAVAACGGSEAAPDAATGDDAQPPGPHTVTVSAYGAELIAYRDGNGPWRTPELVSGVDYELHITADYQLVVGCTSGFGFEATLEGNTWADGADLFSFCGDGGFSADTTVSVTGQMIQPGSVWFDDIATSDTGPWTFTLDVVPGPHDLFGVTTDRVLLRRNQMITAATTVADVDVVVEGALVTSVPLFIDGLDGGETVTTETDWFTDNDLVFLSGSSTEAVRPPPSLVAPNDFEFLSINVESGTSRRGASTFFTGAETSYVLPEVLSGISFDDDEIAASWTSLPFDDSVSFYVGGANGSQSISASTSWLAATQTSQLTFDTDIPGYDADWTVDLSGPYLRSFSVSDYSGPISYRTGIVEERNGSTARALARSDHRQRLLRRAQGLDVPRQVLTVLAGSPIR